MLRYKQYVHTLKVLHAHSNSRGDQSSRLQFWRLLMDPWSVLERVMLQEREGVLCLLPLCEPLRIHRDQFYSRLVMVIARDKTRTWDRGIVCLPSSKQFPELTTEKDANNALKILLEFENACDYGRELVEWTECVDSASARVELWRWMHECFKMHSSQFAFYCLHRAVKDAMTVNETSLLDELQREMLSMRHSLIIAHCDPLLTYDSSYSESSSSPNPIRIAVPEKNLNPLAHMEDPLQCAYALMAHCAEKWANAIVDVHIQENQLISMLQVSRTRFGSRECLGDRERLREAIGMIVGEKSKLFELGQACIVAWLSCPPEDENTGISKSTHKFSSAWLEGSGGYKSIFGLSAAEERRRTDLKRGLAIAFVISVCEFDGPAFGQLSVVAEDEQASIHPSQTNTRAHTHTRHRRKLRLELAYIITTGATTRKLQRPISPPLWPSLEMQDYACSDIGSTCTHMRCCVCTCRLLELIAETEVHRLSYGIVSLKNTLTDPMPLARTLWRDARTHAHTNTYKQNEVLELLSTVLTMNASTAVPSQTSMLCSMVSAMVETGNFRAAIITLSSVHRAHYFPHVMMALSEVVRQCVSSCMKELEERTRRLTEVYVSRERDRSTNDECNNPTSNPDTNTSQSLELLQRELHSLPHSSILLVLGQLHKLLRSAHIRLPPSVETSLSSTLRSLSRLRSLLGESSVLDDVCEGVFVFMWEVSFPYQKDTEPRVILEASKWLSPSQLVSAISKLTSPPAHRVISHLWDTLWRSPQHFEGVVVCLLDNWHTALETHTHTLAQAYLLWISMCKWASEHDRPQTTVSERVVQICAEYSRTHPRTPTETLVQTLKAQVQTYTDTHLGQSERVEEEERRPIKSVEDGLNEIARIEDAENIQVPVAHTLILTRTHEI